MSLNPHTAHGAFLILIVAVPIAIVVAASGLPLLYLIVLIIVKPFLRSKDDRRDHLGRRVQ